MSVDKTRTNREGETLFILRDPEHVYTHSEVCDLLEKAERLGFSLEAGSILEGMTIRDLDILVNRRQ